MNDYAYTVATLTRQHIDDLRQLATNPTHPLRPNRRQMFLRLQLIEPCRCKPTPRDKKRYRAPKRPYDLTELGRKLVTP